MTLRLTLTILSLIFLLGCATEPVVINYSPSTLIEKSGELMIGKIDYMPYMVGKAKANEILKSTVGKLIIDKDVSILIENALKLEFKFSGIKVKQLSRKLLNGKINQLYFDDLGFNVDANLDIDYSLINEKSTCFTRKIITKKTSPKFSNPTGLISQTIKENIEMLLNDEQFINCIK